MSMFKKIVGRINQIIPKTDMILFDSYPPVSDNAYALYSYIVKERPDLCAKYRLCWSVPEDWENDGKIRLSDRTYHKKSILGLWLYLRARYVFCTHNYLDGVESGNGQTVVNLWHGCGYKTLTSEMFYRGDYTIATSDFYTGIQSHALHIPQERSVPTGLPRNDSLFAGTEELKKLGIRKSDFRHIIIWMPTYRKPKDNRGVDGNLDSFGLDDVMSRHFEEVEKILERNGDMLIVKPHPMESVNLYRKDSTRIRFLTNEDLSAAGVELYPLLAETNVLLSDYSSVVIDYLMLNRNIGIVCGDLDDYRSGRGFVVNPIEDYLPGPVICDYDGFSDFLTHLDENYELYRDKRTKLTALFHNHVDGKSSERVIDYFLGGGKS